MDENVKNDAKQVMLVQNADDGRLQAVTGVDRDGTPTPRIRMWRAC